MLRRFRTKPREMLIFGGLVLFFCLSSASAFAANLPPQVGTVIPASGSSSLNQPVTFTTTFSDGNGWQNIQYVYLKINNSTSNSNCLFVQYNQNTNKLYLRTDNDTGGSWLGGFAPGAYMSIENSYAKLDCSMSSVSGSGNTLTVRWNVIFKDTFTGTKNTYLYVRDDTNLYQGWLQKGSWTINQTPVVGSITPLAKTSYANQAVNITTTYTSLGGWQKIDYVYFLIMDSSENNRLYLSYMQNTNQIYLLHIRNNQVVSDWVGGFSPGSSTSIDTPYIKLDCLKTTVSGSGNVMTINWNITLKSAFAGTTNDTYLFVTDDAGGYSSIVKKGSWRVLAAPVLSISVTPKSWDINPTEVGKIITMGPAQKITVTNNGAIPEALELALVNPSGWTASTSAGNETYVLNGIFCNTQDVPVAGNFGPEDVILTQAKRATTSIFAYLGSTANGENVPVGGARALYLQFKSPLLTKYKDQKEISVIVSCQIP